MTDSDNYISAVKGRQDFRRAYREKREESSKYHAAIVKALQHLQFATPRERNGPCYQAIDSLRLAIGLEPMKVGGSAVDGLGKEP